MSRSSGRQHRSMDTLVVSGAIANKHLNGGEAWVRLSWILGLRRLGFDVWFVEQIDEATCVDAAGAPAPFAREREPPLLRAGGRALRPGGASLAPVRRWPRGGGGTAGGAAPGRAGGAPARERQRPPRPRAADEPAAAQGLRGPRPGLHPVLARRRHGRRAPRGARRAFHGGREHRPPGLPDPHLRARIGRRCARPRCSRSGRSPTPATRIGSRRSALGGARSARWSSTATPTRSRCTSSAR